MLTAEYTFVDYSEADAEADSAQYMRECFDVTPHSVLRQWAVSPRADSTDGESALDSKERLFALVDEHLSTLRFASFASAALQQVVSSPTATVTATATHLDSPTHCIDEQWELIPKKEESDEVVAETVAETVPSLPLCVPLSQIVSSMQHSQSAVRLLTVSQLDRDAQRKQLRKDMERDRLLLNSQRLVGAECGLDSLLRSLCDVMRQRIDECAFFADVSSSSSCATDSERERESNLLQSFAEEILLKASRTHSSAMAYQAVQQCVANESFWLLPQSQSTPPIKLTIRAGAWPDSDSDSDRERDDRGGAQTKKTIAGLQCDICCESRYRLQRRVDTLSNHSENDNSCSTPAEVQEQESSPKKSPISTGKGVGFVCEDGSTMHSATKQTLFCEQWADRVLTVTYFDTVSRSFASLTAAAAAAASAAPPAAAAADSCSVDLNDSPMAYVLIDVLRE